MADDVIVIASQRVARMRAGDRHCERSEAIHLSARGSMDCFVATLLAMTRFTIFDSVFKQRGYASACSRRDAPEVCGNICLSLRKEGAGKAGCRLHPWVPCKKKHGGRTTGSTGSSGFPCAMVLRLISCSPR